MKHRAVSRVSGVPWPSRQQDARFSLLAGGAASRALLLPAATGVLLLILLSLPLSASQSNEGQPSVESAPGHPRAPARADSVCLRRPASCPFLLSPTNVDCLSGVSQLYGHLAGDLDGDSWDELVVAFRSRELPGVTSLLWQNYPNGWAEISRQLNLIHARGISERFSGDLDGDGTMDVGVGFKRGSHAWSAVYGQRGKLIYETPVITGPDNNADGLWDGSSDPVAVADLDGDGRCELLVQAGVSFDLSPRGLIAYDVTENRERWVFQCGSTLGDIIPLEDPDTREMVVVVATIAVANGSQDGGFSDEYGYLILLGPDGQVRHKLCMGGVGTCPRVALGDMDRDGRTDLVVALDASFRCLGATHRLCVLDPFSFEVKRDIDPGTFLGLPLIADLDGDGSPEIVSSAENQIFIFDRDLKLIREIPVCGPVGDRLIEDLTGDGQPEIAFILKGTGQVLLITPEGDVLAMGEVAGEILRHLELVQWGPRKKLLYAFSASQASGMSLEHNRDWVGPGGTGLPTASEGCSARGTWGLAVLALFVGAGFGAALAFGLGKSWRRGLRLAWERQTDEAGGKDAGLGGSSEAELRTALTQLTVFGHGEPGALLGRAATLLQAANPGLTQDPEWQQQVAECCMALRKTIPPVLKSSLSYRKVLTEQGSRPEDILAQFREIRDETDTLAGSLRRGGTPDYKSVKRTGQLIFRFDGELRRLRRKLREAFRCDVTHAVIDLLSVKSHVILDAGVQERVLKVRGRGHFIAKIDTQCLQFEVLDDLIANAARAMERSASRKLSIVLEQEGDFVRIRLSDTGCGIDPVYVKSIFVRGVTTRSDGRGLGLFHAQQTLRDFGGRIYIEKTAVGEGTTMVVEIPAASLAPPEEPHRRAGGQLVGKQGSRRTKQ